MIRVVIADARRLMCEGIQFMLRDREGINVTGVVASRDELVRNLDLGLPDVVLFDARLEGERESVLIRDLRRLVPGVPLIALASDELGEDPVAVIRAGAKGYLSKDSGPDDLILAVHNASRGKLYVSHELAERIAHDLYRPVRNDSYFKLSPRETEVFRLLAQGKTVSEIAHLLGLSVKTVSTHKSRVMERLRLSSLSELIQYAISHDLLERDQAAPAPATGSAQTTPGDTSPV